MTSILRRPPVHRAKGDPPFSPFEKANHLASVLWLLRDARDVMDDPDKCEPCFLAVSKKVDRGDDDSESPYATNPRGRRAVAWGFEGAILKAAGEYDQYYSWARSFLIHVMGTAPFMWYTKDRAHWEILLAWDLAIRSCVAILEDTQREAGARWWYPVNVIPHRVAP